MKSSGGLTSGRGITDSVLTRWTLGMIHMQNICEEIESYCEVSAVTPEQHVDARSCRIERDGIDLRKLRDGFSVHPPFPESDFIMSISSGVVGTEDVNCHMCHEEEEKGMKRIVGDNFHDVKFCRKDKVVTLLSVFNSVKAGSTKITPVDPLTLFQRIFLMKQSEKELKAFLKYELAPYPMSLFSEKGTKSSFYNAFVPVADVVRWTE
ncbi:uncharacterized protein LOC126154082 [Schistocerca cancellata]|uniref:uncharacterized protein LOC126154082 n=1 Tax=Schistocerca cancellata TaxID=274614 RepID=UPI0021188488|nr:uncharacterized protein LOC126154082 [Schistocerca cancellata]